ncbi:MAG: hypothetical protein KDE45_14270 [Caldilineaceae bacterium]|nr:hypothetical protein [Caldilineaceae bacterium]
MRTHLTWIIPLAIVLLAAAAFFGVSLYRQLTASVQVTVAPGSGAPVEPAPPPSAEVTEQVAARLRAAGLNEQPMLGDTAISGHMQRLAAGEVDAETLLQYAADLERLNRFSTEQGGSIPTAFWDVRSKEMAANGWDEYTVVRQIAVPEAEPYLLLLAQGYGRFLRFKAAEAAGEDTALDAALDIFAAVAVYQEKMSPQPEPVDDPAAVKGRADAMLMVWQSLVAGSTRTNPLTGEPLFSHSIFARDNVGTIYQYDVGQEMSIAEMWGVTGFAPQFVGIAQNNNQVEHMSISMVLQLVLGESAIVLDGIEVEKAAAGKADEAEAQADMALNNAIQRDFVPFFTGDWQQAVERLRATLKGRPAE